MTDKFGPPRGLTNPPSASSRPGDKTSDTRVAGDTPTTPASPVPGIVSSGSTVGRRPVDPKPTVVQSVPTPVTRAPAAPPAPAVPAVPAAGLTATGETEESVGKIRDILFGGQMKEYEGRFQNLEQHLQRQSQRAHEEMETRFARLESYIREEFGKMSSRIQHEASERTSTTAEIEKNLSIAESRVSSLVQTLDSDLKRDYQDLRRNLYEQGLDIEEKLREARLELTNTMQLHSRQLQDDKVGRDMFASMLDDLAMRLRGNQD